MSIIKDAAIEPFFIKIEPNSFILYEARTKGEKSENAGEETEKVVGHFTTIDSCVRRIAQTKAANSPDFESLSDFLAFNRGQIETLKASLGI